MVKCLAWNKVKSLFTKTQSVEKDISFSRTMHFWQFSLRVYLLRYTTLVLEINFCKRGNYILCNRNFPRDGAIAHSCTIDALVHEVYRVYSLCLQYKLKTEERFPLLINYCNYLHCCTILPSTITILLSNLRAIGQYVSRF